MTALPLKAPSEDGPRAFRGTPDLHQYVPLQSVEQELQQLQDAVMRGDGIVVLTAAPGAGKTVACRHLRAQLHGEFEAVVLSSSEFATRRSLLQAILFELGKPYEGLTEQELRLAILSQARRSLSDRRGLVLIVDEAHLLNPRLLEEMRCLTNHADNGETLIRVVLCAQLALEEMLTLPELQALNYRITCHVTLEPLSMQESAELVAGRLRHVGRQVEDVFTADALETICRVSDGSPRCLVQLCDHTLAISDKTVAEPIPVEVVRRALKDLKQLPLRWNESTTDELTGQQRSTDLESGQTDADGSEWPPMSSNAAWESFEEVSSPSSLDDEPELGNVSEWSSDVPSVEVGDIEGEPEPWKSETENWSTFETEGDAETPVPDAIAEDSMEVVCSHSAATLAPAVACDSLPTQDPAPCTPAMEESAAMVEIPVDDRYASLDQQSGHSIEPVQTTEVLTSQAPIVVSTRAETNSAREQPREAAAESGARDGSSATGDEQVVVDPVDAAPAGGGRVVEPVTVETASAKDFSFEIPAAGFDVVQPQWGEDPVAVEDSPAINSFPASVDEPSVESGPTTACSPRRPYARLFSRLRRERA